MWLLLPAVFERVNEVPGTDRKAKYKQSKKEQEVMSEENKIGTYQFVAERFT